jgi:hypothetical protein
MAAMAGREQAARMVEAVRAVWAASPTAVGAAA